MGKTPLFRPFLIVLPAVLAGCFAFLPNPVVRYHNTDPDPVFFRGAQSNSYRCGGLEFTTSWGDFSWSGLRYRKSYVKPASFRVEVRNLGVAPVLIAPADFMLQGAPGEAPRQAIDPEKILLSIREDMEKLDAEKAGATANHDVVGLLDMIEEKASAAVSPEERAKMIAEKRELRETHKAAMREFADRANRLEADWKHWSDAALRKTTLGPGQSLHGTVAFALDRPFPQVLLLRHLDSVEGARQSPCNLGRYVLEAPDTASSP